MSVRTLEASRAQAIATARADFERTLVVLREENSTLRRMLESASQRADGLTLELTRSLVVQAPVIRPVPASVPKRTTRDPITGLGNVLDPVPLGDPEGEFSSVRAASLMAAEDEPNGAASAA